MKTIPLTQGYEAIVDDEDFDLVSRFKWAVGTNKSGNYYAVTSQRTPPKFTRMHRLILGLRSIPPWVDHKDGNGLNNRRDNLRIATPTQNSGNRKPQKTKHGHGFKGIFLRRKKWQASIFHDGRRIRLGMFLTPELAARAYDAKAKEIHGEFARLNFP